MSINEMQSKVNDLRELRRMADELEAEITAIQDAIKNHMTAEGLDELTGLDFKISWKEITSTRFDSASFKKASPIPTAPFARPAPRGDSSFLNRRVTGRKPR